MFNPEYGDPKLSVPYAQLSKEEQEKDKAQLGPVSVKVKAYFDGLINIEGICVQYKLSTTGRHI